MKVLHIFYELKYSGAEMMYRDSVGLFREAGVDITVVATARSVGEFAERFIELDVSVLHCPDDFHWNPFKAIKYLINLYNILEERRIDVVHVHRHDLYWHALPALIRRIPVVKSIHNNFSCRNFPILICRVFQRFLGRTSLAINYHAISLGVLRNEKSRFWNVARLIPNWIDMKRFSTARDCSSRVFRAEIGLSDDDFVIVSVGRCTAVKGHSDIIRVLARLPSRIHFVHVGCGELESEERLLASELGVGSRVHFLGARDDVPDVLRLCDLMVMPSRFEGLSIAIIEAMVIGIPVVAYKNPGLLDMLDGGLAFLCNQNLVELEHTIIHAIASPLIRQAVAQRAKNAALKQYSSKQNVRAMVEMYKYLEGGNYLIV